MVEKWKRSGHGRYRQRRVDWVAFTSDAGDLAGGCVNTTLLVLPCIELVVVGSIYPIGRDEAAVVQGRCRGIQRNKLAGKVRFDEVDPEDFLR